ncbi:MAG: DUF4012 domain-containing protein [Methanobrevibacter sp.]|nr:DUF4012 domain-containing protein [Methanobrevibacter sp.]
MDRKNKLLMGIIIVGLIGVGALIYGLFLSGPDLAQGNKSVLILAVDESESRPGMGAVDMAFMVELENGSIVNYTPIYPGGMRHPTQSAHPDAQAQGAGAMMLLHDSLWDTDTVQGMKYAQEIVEYNTGMKSDAIVAVNTEAIDAVISAAKIPTSLNAADIVRENDQMYGGSMTRGQAVMSLVRALSRAATNEATRNTMIQTALDQYSNGNIIMEPSGSFMSLLATKGFDSITV